MSAYWLTLLLLLVAASVLFLYAGLRRAPATAVDRDALNKTFYHQRLKELEKDEEEGVIAARQVMVQELQHNLLNDIPGGAATAPRAISRWALLPGVVLLLLVTLGFYLKTGGLMPLLEWQQVKSRLPELRAQLMDPQAKPLSMSQLSQLGLGLRSSLQHDPQNVNDWMMLGRIGMVLNNVQTARQAFQRALQIQPQNGELKLNYAEVLTRSPDPQDNREASVMLQEMLSHNGHDLRLLGLVAFNAYGQQQYDRAIEAWQTLLTLLPAGDKRAEMVQRSIEQAKTQAGQQNSRLALTVNLSDGAKKMLPPDGVMYISVSDGISPVPVAVKKLPLSHFPLSLTLDDSNAMMPERLLSAQHQVQVRVRISRDGSANPQSGDWFGMSAVTPFDGHQQLAVDINQQQP